MEYEVRYYYNTKELDNLMEKLLSFKELKQKPRTYEKTSQYDHTCKEYSFYNKSVDGRFRIRISKNKNETISKLSWKRRLKETTSEKVNKEEEKEVHIDNYENFIYIVENVMHFKLIESYERYRNVFENEEVEISVDEYPFGLALEIESKGQNEIENVQKWVNKLGLKIEDAYRLSWDDKYRELCIEQNIEQYNIVSFDKKMPTIRKENE